MSSTYWNSQVVAAPDGLICALNCALVAVTFEADSLSIEAGSPAAGDALRAGRACADAAPSASTATQVTTAKSTNRAWPPVARLAAGAIVPPSTPRRPRKPTVSKFVIASSSSSRALLRDDHYALGRACDRTSEPCRTAKKRVHFQKAGGTIYTVVCESQAVFRPFSIHRFQAIERIGPQTQESAAYQPNTTLFLRPAPAPAQCTRDDTLAEQQDRGRIAREATSFLRRRICGGNESTCSGVPVADHPTRDVGRNHLHPSADRRAPHCR